MSDLSEKGLVAYNKYFKTPPEILFFRDINEYIIIDGRHRLAMCKELGIKFDFDVKYYIKFVTYQMDKPVKSVWFIKNVRDLLSRWKGLIENYLEIEKYKCIAVPKGQTEEKVL